MHTITSPTGTTAQPQRARRKEGLRFWAGRVPLGFVITLVALAAIGALTVVHVRGLGPGRVVQNLLASAKVSALVVFVALGFALGRHGGGVISASGPVAATGFVLALIPIMFTYSGWNAASYVAEEIRDPGRNVPLALGLGTITVVVIYVALNALYLFALGVPRLAAVQGARLIDSVADSLFGIAVADLVAAFTIVSIAASVSAMVLAGPRVYYAMARDGVFFRKIGELGARSRVPVAAIFLQGITASIIASIKSFDQVLNYVVSIDVLFFGLTGAALFVFRRRDAEMPSIKVPLHPVSTALFVGACWAISLTTVLSAPGDAGWGVLILLLGLPVFWFWRKRAI